MKLDVSSPNITHDGIGIYFVIKYHSKNTFHGYHGGGEGHNTKPLAGACFYSSYAAVRRVFSVLKCKFEEHNFTIHKVAIGVENKDISKGLHT